MKLREVSDVSLMIVKDSPVVFSQKIPGRIFESPRSLYIKNGITSCLERCFSDIFPLRVSERLWILIRQLLCELLRSEITSKRIEIVATTQANVTFQIEENLLESSLSSLSY